MAPTMPRRVVLIRPMDCAPGMTARATRPTTKPTIMCQMMCSIGFLRLDAARVHGRIAPDHHFPRLNPCVVVLVNCHLAREGLWIGRFWDESAGSAAKSRNGGRN